MSNHAIPILCSVVLSSIAGFTSGQFAAEVRPSAPRVPRPAPRVGRMVRPPVVPSRVAQEPTPSGSGQQDPQSPKSPQSPQNPQAPQDPQDPQNRAPTQLTLVRGVDLPVRSSFETDVTDETRRVSLETYYDWDFGKVVMVSETGDLAAVDSPRNWEMRSASDSRGEMVALCFQPSNGTSFVLGEKQEWEPVAERGERTLGDYEVHISLTEKGTLSAIRMDQMSGRSWMLSPAGWIPMRGNLPTGAGEEKK